MIRPAFQSLHASGPVAAASAIVSACSRSINSLEPLTASATVVTVIGSSRSRRVAVSGSSRWWRARAVIVATSVGPYPIRRAITAAMRAPTTE